MICGNAVVVIVVAIVVAIVDVLVEVTVVEVVVMFVDELAGVIVGVIVDPTVVVVATVVVVVVVVVTGVIDVDANATAPVLITLSALTRNEYDVSLMSPVTVALSEVDIPSLNTDHVTEPDTEYSTT